MKLLATIPALLLGLSLSNVANADGTALTLLPVSTGAAAAQPGAAAQGLAARAEVLAEVLADAAYDEGFEVSPSQGVLRTTPPAEEELVARAEKSWVLSAQLEPAAGNKLLVRLVAVAPGSRVLLVRSERMDPNRIEVRAVVMLRELLSNYTAPPEYEPSADAPSRQLDRDPSEPRSAGRPVLALNSALFGGSVGFALQKASGSDDERLIYPLAALGAGLGLGASLLVADEWDVGVGDAWFVSAGALWPAAGGLLLANSYDVTEEDRYLYGIVGASAGLVAATAAVATGSINEGSATIAHSGGAFGLGLGGLGELMVRGNTDDTPIRGMGYGAIGGVVLGGALATQLRLQTSRVLLIDLGASLGALGGAAAASPLLLVEEEEHPTRTRLWLGAVALGTLAGGSLTWLLTDDDTGHAALPFAPYANAWPSADGKAGAELGILGRF